MVLTSPGFPEVTTLETQILSELVDNCPECGYPLVQFLDKLKKKEVKRPLNHLRKLREKGYLRLDNRIRNNHRVVVIKPLRLSYEILGLVNPI